MLNVLLEEYDTVAQKCYQALLPNANEQIAGNLMPVLIQNELRWFWYHHKITWAYAQSRQLERLLKNKSIEINKLFFDNFYRISANILENANNQLFFLSSFLQ